MTRQIQWVFWRVGEEDYRGVDWARELDTDETIVSCDFTFDAALTGLTLVSKTTPSIGNTKTIGKFSGGTAGVTAAIMAKIVTSTERKLHVLALMDIE